MAYYAPNTVDVNVFLSTSPSQIKSFDVVAGIVNGHSHALIETYLDAKGVLSAGYAINSPAYMMAQGLFNGGIAGPSVFKLITNTVKTYTITIPFDLHLGDVVSVNAVVNGVSKVVECEITGEGNNTKNQIAANLKAKLAEVFPTSDNKNPTFAAENNVITITPATVAGAYTSSFGWNSVTGTVPHTVIGSTSDTTHATVLTEALTLDDNISFVISEDKTNTSIQAVAGMMKENALQFFTSTNEAASKNNAEANSLLGTLQALENNYVSCQWSDYALTHFPEAAFLGNIAGLKPYNLYNPSGVTLSGVPKDDHLTQQERITIKNRNGNYYITERGYGQYKDGNASGGDFVDTIRTAIWAKETTEQILFDLKRRQTNLGKTLPYSDAGSVMMQQAIVKDLINVGIRGGRIATGTTRDEFGNLIDLNPVVDFGTRAQQTDADITNRIWRNGKIEFVMLSGINYIETNIYVLSNRQFEL